MKIVIAGGRDYIPTKGDELLVRQALINYNATEVVSGMASGADRFGESIARQMGLTITRFPADWIHEGKKAGPIRNKKMAEYCDAVILLPGDGGTASMRAEAIKAGKPILYESLVWEPPK